MTDTSRATLVSDAAGSASDLAPTASGNRGDTVVVNAKDLPVWDAIFSRDEGLLHGKIKKIKPDYNKNDPKTWPIFTPHEDIQRLMDDHTEPTLPRKVAYSVQFMNMYEHLPDAKKALGRELVYSSLFRDYPFSFTETGHRRVPQVLTESSYNTWMRNFGDLRLLSAQSDAPVTTQNPQVTSRVANAQNNAPVIPQNSAVSPQVAYEQVMTTLHAPNIFSSAEVDGLKKNLDVTKDELKTSMEEVATNKGLFDTFKAKSEKLEKELNHLQGLTMSLNQLVKNKDKKIDEFERNKQYAARARKDFELKIKTRDEQLLAEKGMRTKSEQHVLDIWAMMQQVTGSKGGQKRALSSDGDTDGDSYGERGSSKRLRKY
jgi:hypothetical protein